MKSTAFSEKWLDLDLNVNPESTERKLRPYSEDARHFFLIAIQARNHLQAVLLCLIANYVVFDSDEYCVEL
jgi:hypothetical protein